MSRPRVSFVLATHNRREAVLHTLRRLDDCGLDRRDFEIIIVDNASADGTAESIEPAPQRTVIKLDQNFGSCAKAVGVDRAAAPLLLFVDDDSSPRAGCVERMIRAFERSPNLAAAGFTVHLPDGSQECSALPHVFVGCGVGLRTRAVRHVGGLDRTFFMQAEEYDLSLRLLQSGLDVEIFADLEVDHLKSPTARQSERTTFMDVRNNLRVAARYLPDAALDAYRRDWALRYLWLARLSGHAGAFRKGYAAGIRWALRERVQFARWRLGESAFEKVLCRRLIAARMAELRDAGARRILLADLGKNIHAFVSGAASSGLEIAAVADDRFACAGRRYRGVPVVPLEEGLRLAADAIVIANTSYVHATRRHASLRGRVSAGLYQWFKPPTRRTDDEPRKPQLRAAD